MQPAGEAALPEHGEEVLRLLADFFQRFARGFQRQQGVKRIVSPDYRTIPAKPPCTQVAKKGDDRAAGRLAFTHSARAGMTTQKAQRSASVGTKTFRTGAEVEDGGFLPLKAVCSAKQDAQRDIERMKEDALHGGMLDDRRIPLRQRMAPAGVLSGAAFAAEDRHVPHDGGSHGVPHKTPGTGVCVLLYERLYEPFVRQTACRVVLAGAAGMRAGGIDRRIGAQHRQRNAGFSGFMKNVFYGVQMRTGV